MKKKFVYSIIFFLIFWTVIVVSILVLQKTTRVWENIIETNIKKSLPQNSTISISKINGNIFGDFRVDSINITIDSTIIFSVKNILIDYSLFSLLKGVPKIHSIEIDKPQLDLHFKEEKKPEVKSIPFNFKEKQIKFERVLPDTFHLLVQHFVQQLPDTRIDDFIINGLNININRNNIVSRLVAKISYSRKKIILKDLRGILLSWFHIKKGGFIAEIDKNTILISRLNIQTDKSYVIGKIDIDYAEKFKALAILDECSLREDIGSLVSNDTTNMALDSKGYIYLYPESLYFDISMKGKYRNVILEKSNVHGIVGKRSAYIPKFYLKTNMGLFTGKIYSQFGGKTLTKCTLRDINLAYIIDGIDSSCVNIELASNVDSWNFKKASGNLNLKIWNTYVNNYTIHESQIKIHADNGLYKIDSTSGLFLNKKDRFLLSGTVQSDLKGEIDLSFQDMDFQSLGKALQIPSLKGFGSGIFKIYGNLKDPDAYSYLLLDSLSLGGQIFYGIEENIEIKNLFSRRIGNYTLDISSGLINGTEITDALIGLTLQGAKVFIDSLTFYNLENFISIKGNIDYSTDSIQISLNDLEVAYQNLKLYNDDSIFVNISIPTSQVLFEYFHLISNVGGEIDARGMLSWKNKSEFALFIDKINLNFVNQFNLFNYSAKGFVNFEVIVEDKINSPLINFDGKFTNLKLDSVQFGSIILNGNLENNILQVQQFDWNSKDDSMEVKAKLDLGLFRIGQISDSIQNSFLFHIQRLDLKKVHDLFALNFPLEGIIRGKMEIHNQTDDWNGKGKIDLLGFRYADFKLDTLQVGFLYKNNLFSINTGILNLGRSTIYFSGTSNIPSNKILSMNPDSIPISIFASMKTNDVGFLGDINDELQNIRGDINANLQIEGTVANPVLAYGNVSINDAKMYLYRLANPLYLKKVKAKIENNMIFLEEVNGFSRIQDQNNNLLNRITSFLFFWKKKDGNKGTFSIKGKISLDEKLKPYLDLKVKASKIFINYFLEDIRIEVSTNDLTVKGRDTISVVGNVEVHRGRYLFNSDRYERSLLISTSEVETPPYLKLNINLDLPGNFYFKQEGTINKMSFEILGKLRILKEAGGFIEPYGILEILSGEIGLYGKKIKVKNGKISFDNPKELPTIELLAGYRSPPYYFEISEMGKIDAPDLQIEIFDINTNEKISGYDMKDKLSLLVTGMLFSDLTRQGDQAIKEQGIEIAAKSLMAFIEGQTENMVGLDKVSLEPSNKLNQGISDFSLSLGKYLTNNLYFEYKSNLNASPFAQKLTWEPGNEVYLLYRLNRNWSIGTSFSKTENNNNKINFNFSWKIYF